MAVHYGRDEPVTIGEEFWSLPGCSTSSVGVSPHVGLDPTPATCAALMSAFEQSGSSRRAVQLVEAMQKAGMSLDNDTAAAAMRTVAAARQHQQAKRLLSSCRALGLQPSDELVAVFLTSADSGTSAHAELMKFLQGLGIQVSAAKRS